MFGFFFAVCILLHMCDLAPFLVKMITTIIREKKNILMYNSFYLLYVESKKNRRNKKEEKKEAPYLLNKTPTTNWFLYLSYSISISLKTNASLYHHYSPPHIYTTKKTDDYINLATNLHLEKKRKLNGIRSVAKPIREQCGWCWALMKRWYINVVMITSVHSILIRLPLKQK